ncbi:cobalt-precorrin 5A hydrolase / precorrin-3B C17-methyltransferase [Azospirillaceae bacterium]
MNDAPALIILGNGSLPTARRIQAACPGSIIYGLASRVQGADQAYAVFGETIRDFFARDVPIVAFCASGIIIRSLAPLLHNKRAEPPVLAVAEDGSAVVPLLGGLRGVNMLARRIGEALSVLPAITTTGEIRFRSALEHPPVGYVLRNPDDGKRFMSDLLAGATVKIIGDAPWLAQMSLPQDDNGSLCIRITDREQAPAFNELIYHAQTVVVAVASSQDFHSQDFGAQSFGAEGLNAEKTSLLSKVETALASAHLSRHAVAQLLIPEADAAQFALHDLASWFGGSLRLIEADQVRAAAHFARMAVPDPRDFINISETITIAVAHRPEDIVPVGRPRGRLAVVGIGPGASTSMTMTVKEELHHAQDIVGYQYYVDLAGPFRSDQVVHASDNRVEKERACLAFRLAAQGRRVVVVSSGDPGIFAMASAVMEVLHLEAEPTWQSVELIIQPGVSAAQAAAARSGAPLGHDFCVLSLSDNLKPWSVIEKRLHHVSAADLVIALYNPASLARPYAFSQALSILRHYRDAKTPVVLGRNIDRTDETLIVTTLGEMETHPIDMRTVVLIGSSLTQTVSRMDGGAWVYTPRWYQEASRTTMDL